MKTWLTALQMVILSMKEHLHKPGVLRMQTKINGSNIPSHHWSTLLKFAQEADETGVTGHSSIVSFTVLMALAGFHL